MNAQIFERLGTLHTLMVIVIVTSVIVSVSVTITINDNMAKQRESLNELRESSQQLTQGISQQWIDMHDQGLINLSPTDYYNNLMLANGIIP